MLQNLKNFNTSILAQKTMKNFILEIDYFSGKLKVLALNKKIAYITQFLKYHTHFLPKTISETTEMPSVVFRLSKKKYYKSSFPHLSRSNNFRRSFSTKPPAFEDLDLLRVKYKDFLSKKSKSISLALKEVENTPSKVKFSTVLHLGIGGDFLSKLKTKYLSEGATAVVTTLTVALGSYYLVQENRVSSSKVLVNEAQASLLEAQKGESRSRTLLNEAQAAESRSRTLLNETQAQKLKKDIVDAEKRERAQRKILESTRALMQKKKFIRFYTFAVYNFRLIK